MSLAKQSIERLGSVLDLYKLDAGTYPSTEQGLAALVDKPSDGIAWNGPYVKGDKLPLDPWNREFVYRAPSVRSGHDYDLCSRGPQGVEGDPGQGGMICNP